MLRSKRRTAKRGGALRAGLALRVGRGSESAARSALGQPCVEKLERRCLLAVVPAGSEFRVNTYTTGAQTSPAVACDPIGDFVVVWGDHAQLYNSTGVAQGTELQVKANKVAMDATGDFVVTWQTPYAEDGSNAGVDAQRFDETGAPQGGEIRVNTYTTNAQQNPSITVDSSGDFIIAWVGAGLGDTSGVFAKRYDSAGVAQGAEFLVNTYTTGAQYMASIAADANGDFVVVWSSIGQDGSSNGVYAQRYNAAGAAQGAEFRVNAYTTNLQWRPSVAVDAGGDFVIAWTSQQDGSVYGVYAQRYNSAGMPQGGEFQVNTYTTGSQTQPSVAMDDAGDFVIAWKSNLQDGSGYGVYSQRYNSSGIAQGAEFRVNTYTSNFQTNPVVAMDGAGDFIITWYGYGSGDADSGIFAQRYVVTPVVTVSSFQFDRSPQRLIFTFDLDVSASVSLADITLQNLSGGSAPVLTMLPYGTDGPNTATFVINSLLPDGNYRATLQASGITIGNGTPMAADSTFEFFSLSGDANRDRIVDINDLWILATNWGGTGRTFAQGDFNGDWLVNSVDLGMLAHNWQQVLTSPAPALPAALATPPRRTATRVIQLI